jgi:hypothetical protein
MNLQVLQQETFHLLLNSGLSKITDSGPLSFPVKSFEIKRDENQNLTITATSIANKRDCVDNFNNLETNITKSSSSIKFNCGDINAVASGVWNLSSYSNFNPTDNTGIRSEKACFESIESIPDDSEQVHYLIEWLDNIDTSLYIWPHGLKEESVTTFTRTFLDDSEASAQHSIEKNYSVKDCLKLNVAGNEIYIVPSTNKSSKRSSGHGFILYKKFPPEDFRRKIRECLSFTFGQPLIYLGYTLLSNHFEFIGFKAISPYTYDEKIYDVQASPPTSVGNEHANKIDPNIFGNTVNSLFKHYDELNFQHIFWIYWHAFMSPPHSQPAQLGAGIEALQQAYRKSNRPEYKTQLLSTENARHLKSEYIKLVNEMNLNEDEKDALLKKASTLNNPSQDTLNDRFFACLSLKMCDKEKSAWKRRNDSAHGKIIERDDFLALLNDIEILKSIFNRIIIKMCQA